MNFHQKTNQFESLESTLIILKMRLKYQELLIGSASIVLLFTGSKYCAHFRCDKVMLTNYIIL